MNTLILLFPILFNCPLDDSLCREDFYNRASRDSSFGGLTFLKIPFSNYNGVHKIGLIPNHSLYFFLRDKKGMSFENYKAFLGNFFRTNASLSYSDFGTLPQILEDRPDIYVEKIAGRGKSKFIGHFFEGRVFKYAEHAEHFKAVVSKLFDKGILVTLSENGGFAISFEADCPLFSDW